MYNDSLFHPNKMIVIIVIVTISTGQTAYADGPRGDPTPQKELNDIYIYIYIYIYAQIIIQHH